MGGAMSMKYDIIEAEYTDLSTTPANITTESVVGFANSVMALAGKISNDVKEYKITREEERTKRIAIKSQLKQEIAKIDAFKEIALTTVNNTHKENIQRINNFYRTTMKEIDTMCDVLHKVIETDDIELIKASTDKFVEIITMRSEIEMKLMENTCTIQQPINFLNE